MAFSITNESQLIDIDTILLGCESLKSAADDFTQCGNTVKEAGEVCDKKALSIDEKTLKVGINELGEEIINSKKMVDFYADNLASEAVNYYNQQVRELNEYNNWLSQQQQQP